MSKKAIEKRLTSYWKMEAVNVLLIPFFFVWFVWLLESSLGPATYGALVPVCLLLAIGAYYWRAKLFQLQSGGALPAGMAWLSRLQIPSLVLTLGAIALAAYAWIDPGFSVSSADRWSASIAALLALLEYVNYYHRQLQHFDHAPDIKRLLSGKGFRRSQMAADLARWRAKAA